MRGCRLTRELLPSGAVRIALRGELDLDHAYAFDEQLRHVECSRPPCIVLDLRELTFMDSCGMGRLLAARRRARKAGRRLVLVRGGRAVQYLLAVSGMEEAFEIVSEIPASLQFVSEPA
jgi:anti-sigma B factor antagonist